MSDGADAFRAKVSAALSELEPMSTSWVIAYETTELDTDGDVGNAWGSIFAGASPITVLGLLHAAQAELSADLVGGEDA